MIVPINFVGKTGLIKDQEPYDLAPEFFTDCRNVAFELGGVRRAPSWRQLLTYVGIGTPPTPYGLFFAHGAGNRYWVYTGLTAIYSISSTTFTDRSRTSGGAYTGTATDYWQGGMFNDVVILNNGIDVPQFWDLPGSATSFENLTNWPSTHRARVVRPFKNFLVALDVTISGAHDDRLVLWSHPADPLSIPSSWDVADETLDAGQVSLGEGEDSIIDGLQVGNVFMIGTGSQTWVMSFTGGQDVMAFRKVFNEVGLLAQGCAVTFLNRVFQVTQDDIVIHDLQSVQQVGGDKVRRWFFDNLTPDSYGKVRVVKKQLAKEIWVCFNYGGSATTNMALVYNWQFDTWTLREIDAANHSIASGLSAPLTSGGIAWSAASGDWASQTGVWDSSTYERASEGLAQINTSLQLSVNGIEMDPADVTVSMLERTGLGVKGVSGGTAIIDHGHLAVMREIWPKFVAADGITFEITIGFSMSRTAPVTWQPSQNFVTGTDTKLGFFGTYRYLAVRVRCLMQGVDWKLIGFDLDVEATACL